MKTTLSILAIVLFFNLTIAQTTAIPDANFEQALINLGYDTGVPNGTVPTANINSVTVLNVSSKNINDLTGIADFTALDRLYCTDNQLTNLDVTQNSVLTTLFCDNNQLTSLDVTQNIALINLSCRNMQLTSLNVTQNISLRKLFCQDNQITSLDVTQNTTLIDLFCYNNQLTSLDVTQNTALTYLHCYDNQLTSLDVTQNTALRSFNCGNNQLTNMDVTQNTVLIWLICSNNQLTNLDVTQNTALTLLIFSDNQLTSLDLTQNTALITLVCYNNQLTSLDVTQNTALTNLTCYNNQLTSLDVSQLALLTRLECQANNLLCLDVKNGNNLNSIEFHATLNPNLNCIKVDDVAWSTVNWIYYIDSTSSFSTNCPLVDLGIDTTICDQDVLTLGDTNSFNTFLWNDGSNGSTYNVTSQGTYWVEVTNGCGGISSDTININYLPLPSVTIANFNTDTLCTNSSAVSLPSGFPIGGYFSGLGVSGGLFDPSLAGAGQHNVIYTFTDTNSCINSDTTTIIINSSWSISDTLSILQGDSILIYGNYQNIAGVYYNSLLTIAIINVCEICYNVTWIYNKCC